MGAGLLDRSDASPWSFFVVVAGARLPAQIGAEPHLGGSFLLMFPAQTAA